MLVGKRTKLRFCFSISTASKSINDSLGHSSATCLLQEVANDLRNGRVNKTRWPGVGGDEFLIVLNNVKDISDAAVAAERFMDAMTAEFVVQGHPLALPAASASAFSRNTARMLKPCSSMPMRPCIAPKRMDGTTFSSLRRR